MSGSFAVPCPDCGEVVLLESPHCVDVSDVVAEDDYEEQATRRGACDSCGATASAVVPVVFLDGPRSYAILALPPQRLPGGTIAAIVNDLLDVLPAGRRHQLALFATYEAFRLERAHPEICGGTDLREVLARDVTEESTMIQDVANGVQQAGEPLLALEHLVRILRHVPDFLAERGFAENLALLQALAAAREPDNPRVAELRDAIDGLRPAGGKSWPEVEWRHAYAFGPDAPLLRGVPAGYVVPGMYVDSGTLAPDERAIVSFLTLLFSSALQQLVPEPRGQQALMHSLTIRAFERRWRDASDECRTSLIDFYRDASGRSLLADLDLDAGSSEDERRH